jgi:hypothetical protein
MKENQALRSAKFSVAPMMDWTEFGEFCLKAE